MNRKIMIEVTPQEYEKIQAGKLNIEDLTVEQLIKQLINKLEPYDCNIINNPHPINPWVKNELLTISKYNYEIDELHSVEIVTKTIERR